MAVILPEVIIANQIRSSLAILKRELNDPSMADADTTLFGYFGDTSISDGQYNLFDQMKSLLLLDPALE